MTVTEPDGMSRPAFVGAARELVRLQRAVEAAIDDCARHPDKVGVSAVREAAERVEVAQRNLGWTWLRRAGQMGYISCTSQAVVIATAGADRVEVYDARTDPDTDPWDEQQGREAGR